MAIMMFVMLVNMKRYQRVLLVSVLHIKHPTRSPEMEPMWSPQKRPMRSPQTEPMRSPQTEPMRSPETDPMWSQQTEPTQSPEMDPMRSPQTGARAHAPWPPPVELDAEGQALRERLRVFRTQAVKKNYKGLPPCDSLNRTYLGLVQRPHDCF
jgi:hypothetical protein